MRRVLSELDGADCHQNRREAASVAGVRNQHDHPGQAQSAAAAAAGEGREDLRILQVAANTVSLATDLGEQGCYQEALQLFQETCAMLTDKDWVASRSTLRRHKSRATFLRPCSTIRGRMRFLLGTNLQKYSLP